MQESTETLKERAIKVIEETKKNNKIEKFVCKFMLTVNQQKKLNKWKKNQAKKSPSEKYMYSLTYKFTPFEFGEIIIVSNGYTKEEINLTNYNF